MSTLFIHQAFEDAMAILKVNRTLLDSTAQKLLFKETLNADELPTVDPYHIDAHSGTLTAGSTNSRGSTPAECKHTDAQPAQSVTTPKLHGV